jgi:hypothetical protein
LGLPVGLLHGIAETPFKYVQDLGMGWMRTCHLASRCAIQAEDKPKNSIEHKNLDHRESQKHRV